MKKISLFLFLVLTLLYMYTLSIDAAELDAYLVMTNPGEDMSMEVNVVWHTKVDGTFVQYAKKDEINENNEFTNSKYVFGECEAISHYDPGKNYTYDEKKCSATLKNLESGTEYIYRVGKSNFSQNYHFETAKYNSPFSFLYMSDVHIYNSITSRLSMAENLLSKASGKEKLSFSVFGGDMLAYGSDYSAWESLSTSTLSTLNMFAFTPGNHDFYNNKAQTQGPGYFRTFMNNPTNGAEGVKNTSYFFKYNNTLFISISNEDSAMSNSALLSQKTWFEEVVNNNPSQFIVVYTHRPFYNGSASNAGHANTNRTNWSGLFDKYGVDLVLSGHDHVYVRTKSTYNGEVNTDPNKGTVYITSTAVGDRWSEENNDTPYTNLAYVLGGQKISTALIVNVDNEKISLRLMDQDGVIKDSAEVNAKREGLKFDELDKELLLESINTINHEEDNTKAIISLDPSNNQYIDKIEVLNEDDLSLGIYRLGSGENNIQVDNLIPNKFLNIKVVVSFLDGSFVEKELVVSTKKPFGEVTNIHIEEIEGQYYAVWSSQLINDQVKRFTVYLNDMLVGNTTVSNNKLFLPEFNPYEDNNLKIILTDRYGDDVHQEIYLYEKELIYPESLEINSIDELEIGDEEQLLITINPSNSSFTELSFSSSNESVVIVDENGIIKAIDKGSATITVSVNDTDIVNTIVVVVKDPYVSVEDITIEDVENIKVGDIVELIVNTTPINSTNKTLEFKSSDTAVATVDENGKVTAIKSGTVIITVSIDDIEEEIEIIVEDEENNDDIDDENNSNPDEKKGCGKNNTIIVALTLGIIFFLLRKRKIM